MSRFPFTSSDALNYHFPPQNNTFRNEDYSQHRWTAEGQRYPVDASNNPFSTLWYGSNNSGENLPPQLPEYPYSTTQYNSEFTEEKEPTSIITSPPRPIQFLAPIVPAVAPAEKIQTSAGANTRDILSHAARNPELPTQPDTRRKPGRQRSEAEKAARKITTQVNQTKALELAEAVEKLKLQQEEQIVSIAAEFGRKPAYVRRLVQHGEWGKQRRQPGLFQAQVHHLAQTLNRDSTGPQYKLHQLQQMVTQEPWRIWSKDGTEEGYEEMDDIEEDSDDDEETATEKARRRRLSKALLSDLQNHQERRAKGARQNHRAAALDIEHTKSELQLMCENLYSRTGAISVGFVTRGSADCTGQSGFFVGGPAGEFCLRELGHNLWDILILMESWAMKRDLNNTSLKVPEKRVECTKMIVSGLRQVSKDPNAVMRYSSYTADIIANHRVKLINWPEGVPFIPPSELKNALLVSSLFDALATGVCRWVNLTKKEVEDMVKEVTKDGEPLKKPRKERSDKAQSKIAYVLPISANFGQYALIKPINANLRPTRSNMNRPGGELTRYQGQ